MESRFFYSYIFFLRFIIFLGAIFKSEHACLQSTRNYSTLINTCIHSTEEASDKILWDDPRIYSVVGRREIIEEAKKNVEKYIQRCSNSLILGKFKPFNISGSNRYPIFRDNPARRYIDVKISIYYAAQKDNTAYARNILIGKIYENKIAYKKFEETIRNASGFAGYFVPTEEYETFVSRIEIFPYVFIDRSFQIPNQQNPWAKNPVEAIEFIILHELGHLDVYLGNRSKIGKFYSKINVGTSSEEEEQAMDDLASSIWECYMNYYKK